MWQRAGTAPTARSFRFAQLLVQPIAIHCLPRGSRTSVAQACLAFTVTTHRRVPISLVYRTDLAKLDGTDPLLLDAYGRCAHAAFHLLR